MKPRIVSGECGPMKLSAGGKRAIAQSMYAKGKAFIEAALLLRQRGGYEFVVLHLICHGVENVLKGLLLNHDYDKYYPKLKYNRKLNGFGRNLMSITKAALEAFRRQKAQK